MFSRRDDAFQTRLYASIKLRGFSGYYVTRVVVRMEHQHVSHLWHAFTCDGMTCKRQSARLAGATFSLLTTQVSLWVPLCIVQTATEVGVELKEEIENERKKGLPAASDFDSARAAASENRPKRTRPSTQSPDAATLLFRLYALVHRKRLDINLGVLMFPAQRRISVAWSGGSTHDQRTRPKPRA